jgi:hypothetical protein
MPSTAKVRQTPPTASGVGVETGSPAVTQGIKGERDRPGVLTAAASYILIWSSALIPRENPL